MGTKLKILHIEDFETDVELICNELKKANLDFEILVVDTESEFKKAIKGYSPDIILSDHSLPSFNSHEALSVFHESGMKIPFILVTGTMSDEFAADVMKKGASDYILKDRLNRLPSAIQNSLEKCRLEKEGQVFLNELIKSEKCFRALVENSTDAVFILNSEGKPIYVSPSIKRVLGYSEAEAIQLDMYEILHPDDRESVDQIMIECMKKPGISIEGNERRVKHKNGSWIWLESTITNMLHDDGIKGIIDNFRDITERKFSEEKIINANRLYNFISQINQTIVHAQDEQTVFKESCRIAIELGKFNAAWIGMIDTSNKKINIIEGPGIVSSNLSIFTDVPYENDEPEQYVLSTGSYYLCNDIQSNPKLKYWKRYLSEREYGSVIVLPIRKSGSIIATFNLYASEINFFNEAEIALLVEASNDISFSLDVFEKEKQRTQSEQLLKYKQFRLSQAQSIAHLGSWELEFSTGIALWSEEACRIYGLSPEDNFQSYESWLSFLHPDDRDYVLETIKQGEETLSNTAIFHRIIRRDGTIRHIYGQTQFQFNSEGRPVGVYGVVHDVTEMKEAEEALRISESTLKSTFDNTSEGFFLIDINGNIRLFNNKAKEFVLLNSPEKVSIGKSIFDFIHTFRKENFKTILAKVLSGETIRYEHCLERENDEAIWFNFTINPVYNKVKIEGVCITISDISQHKLSEMHLKKLNKNLENYTKELIISNKDLEQFSYIVSHNLRAPVANIIGLTNELNNDVHNNETKKILKTELLSSVKRLDNVIIDLNSILKVKKEVSENKEIVNLSELIGIIKSSIKNLIQKESVQIKTNFIYGNEFNTLKSYLHSIFYNLISNSIKYRQPSLPPVIEISSRRYDSKLVIIFEDNGTGIDMEKNGGQVFGLYKRFHPNIEGKGMGLFMVKTQVEMLGGKITIQSEINKGTEFKIEFQL